MALSLTMASLVLASKRACDKENDDSISSTEWPLMVSDLRREAFEIVADTGCRYSETEGSITATGAASYAEPTDLRTLIGVDIVWDASSGQRDELDELMIGERNVYSGLTGQAKAFAHIAALIYLYPKPSSGSYKVLYIPQAADVSAETSIDVFCDAGRRFIVYGTALAAYQKSKGDWDPRRAEKVQDLAREDLMCWAANRALTEPRRKTSGEFRRRLMPGDWR